MDRSELVSFLRDQKWAVEATVSVHGVPQAAVIGIAVTDELEIVFDTFEDARKTRNLRQNKRMALVVGWDDGRTVQLEGIADEPRGDELERLKKVYFARFPDGEERAKKGNVVYVRVRPTWARVSDFRSGEPVMTVIEVVPPRPPRRSHRPPPAPVVEEAPAPVSEEPPTPAMVAPAAPSSIVAVVEEPPMSDDALDADDDGNDVLDEGEGSAPEAEDDAADDDGDD
jgi:general stress protein 26